jgi:hypothetical protein
MLRSSHNCDVATPNLCDHYREYQTRDARVLWQQRQPTIGQMTFVTSGSRKNIKTVREPSAYSTFNHIFEVSSQTRTRPAMSRMVRKSWCLGCSGGFCVMRSRPSHGRERKYTNGIKSKCTSSLRTAARSSRAQRWRLKAADISKDPKTFS